MSRPFDAEGSAEWAEAELRRACAELDGHIPDDYLDGFSSRLAANLEAETMETIESNPDRNPDSGSVAMPPSQDANSTDEHSGLHEIKALASSARERITRRRTTEHDLEESLLASSSAGLPAVVLPDPERSTPQMAIIETSSTGLPVVGSVTSPAAAPMLEPT